MTKTANQGNANFTIVCSECGTDHGFDPSDMDDPTCQLTDGNYCGDCFCGGVLTAKESK